MSLAGSLTHYDNIKNGAKTDSGALMNTRDLGLVGVLSRYTFALNIQKWPHAMPKTIYCRYI